MSIVASDPKVCSAVGNRFSNRLSIGVRPSSQDFCEVPYFTLGKPKTWIGESPQQHVDEIRNLLERLGSQGVPRIFVAHYGPRLQATFSERLRK